MAVLYVTSGQKGAGKTSFCAALARKIGDRGAVTRVFKPLGDPHSELGSDPDAGIFGALLDQPVDGWPVELPDASLTPRSLEDIKAAYDRVSLGADVVLVEGSTPTTTEESRRIADLLDAKVLVVTRHTPELTAGDLKLLQGHFGDRLIGVVINGMSRYMGTSVRTILLPEMESEGLVSFGVVPEDRRLLGVSVGQLAEHLDGRFVTRGRNGDALVEHLMVGGMGMDPGELSFGLRENKAVIVRGDRPDIQMAVLTTPTACMVLTRGIEPIEYVTYEAEQEEVSIIVVETDTLATMDSVKGLVDRALFDHSSKLDRMVELLDEHVDLPALLRAAGVG